jgi:uncharacterized protein (TIGR02001 family)
MNIHRLAAVATLALWAAAVTTAGAQPAPPRLSGYVTVTTDYGNRGLSQTDGQAALQAGLDYQHPSGLFAGALVSNVEFAVEEGEEDRRRTELDYYLGYDWQRDGWALTATLARYTYPGAGSAYDYNEITAGVRFRDRVYLTTSRTGDFASNALEVSNHELTVVLPLRRGFELGATVGRTELDPIPAGAYTHWNVGVSKLAGRFSVDLRFHDNDYGITTYLGAEDPDRWVLSVTYGFAGE